MEEIARPVPEILLDYDPILKGGERFWDDVNGGYLPEDLVLAARSEDVDWVHSRIVHQTVPVQECRDAGMKPLDLICVDADKSVDPTRKKIRSRLCARKNKTKKQGKIQRALPPCQLFSTMPPLEAVKVLAPIVMSVSLSNKGKPSKLRHYDASRAHFHGTAQRLICIRLPAEDRQKHGEDKVGRLIKSMYGTQDASHIWQHDYVNLICGELGGCRRGKHGVRRKTESDSKERRSNTIQICLRETFMTGPRQIGSGGNSETFGPEDERASGIRLYPVETCSAVSGGKAQSSAEISKTETC